MTDLLVKKTEDVIEFYDPLDDGEPITVLSSTPALIGIDQIVGFLSQLGNDVHVEDA